MTNDEVKKKIADLISDQKMVAERANSARDSLQKDTVLIQQMAGAIMAYREMLGDESIKAQEPAKAKPSAKRKNSARAPA